MQYRLVAVDVSPQRLVDIPNDYVILGAQYTQNHTWQILCLAPLGSADRGIEGFTLTNVDDSEGTEDAEVPPKS